MSLTRFINLRLPESPDQLSELWVDASGHFIAPPEDGAADAEFDLEGQLVLPGLIETHVHLDKACIMDRCRLVEGSLQEAISETSKAKQAFDPEDIYQRGRETLEKAILQGTTWMRTHVEIDPVIGLQGLEAILRLKQEYRWAITLQVCVFPQEGMFNNPGTEALLLEALDLGADLLGGCPYTDSEPVAQIERLFDIAVERDLDLDFHLDFDLDPANSLIPAVVDVCLRRQWQGRVTIGHATKLSALPPARLAEVATSLVKAGIAVTALPATDLYLNGRGHDHLVPRGVSPLHRLSDAGVCCSISTNNIGNPFTPFGDMSLVRQANLFANLAQLGTPADFERCLDWVSVESARLLGLDRYGLKPGCRADFITLTVDNRAGVVRDLSQPTQGFKGGQQTFTRPQPQLLRPERFV
ncbi:amidohydrolase family protein [Marinobacterium mangrovicola]|uniref:Cytosine deaminase n=1 Tax=Marinobacterium mangrovicola TaxID=1476959 RepID=A0A4R1GGU1_9GAMM|nr:amidohydrolase family protein [Marinobacterium mangrovicola]TCK06150.1 cytosine deaminase [Marinobacterium mangrovicola]